MPKKIQNFARSALVKPVTINVGRAGAASLDVIQEVEYVKQEAKVVYLLECLQKTPPPVSNTSIQISGWLEWKLTHWKGSSWRLGQSSSLPMKTSCLRLKLVELNFFASFTTDDQSIFNVSGN